MNDDSFNSTDSRWTHVEINIIVFQRPLRKNIWVTTVLAHIHINPVFEIISLHVTLESFVGYTLNTIKIEDIKCKLSEIILTAQK